MDILFAFGAVLVVGYFFGLMAERFNFPRVTAYLICGILFSPALLGNILNLNLNSWSDFLVQISLGFIAFIVGGKIEFSKLKKNGKVIFWSTLLSSLLPVIFVLIGFVFLSNTFHLDFKVAIILASVASTTDAAATIAVIDQFKAKGTLTDTLLGIVALDDGLGVLLFSLITTIAFQNAFHLGVTHIFHEIGLSIFLGTILGLLLSKFAHLSKSNDYLFPLLAGLILISVSLSEQYNTSSLLTCIMLGFVSTNTFKSKNRISLILPIEHIEEFVFITFFTLAGLQFSVEYFLKATPIIFSYVILRAIGKYLGAYAGTKIVKSTHFNNSKWLGFTLLPQAGIAIGLILQITNTPELNQFKPLLINTILGATIIYEFLGPIFAKYALKRAHELNN